MIWIVILFYVIATEAVTEILTSSKLTEPFRMWIKQITYPIDSPPPVGLIQYFKVWFDTLISCGYCMSVWVSAFFNLVYPITVISCPVQNFVVMVFVVHRLSNLLHVCYELIRRGRVHSVDLTMTSNRGWSNTINDGGINGGT